MEDPDDPLDLLNDDGNGVVEMCLFEEEEKHRKGPVIKNSGCCVLLLLLGTSLLTAAWCVSRLA